MSATFKDLWTVRWPCAKQSKSARKIFFLRFSSINQSLSLSFFHFSLSLCFLAFLGVIKYLSDRLSTGSIRESVEKEPFSDLGFSRSDQGVGWVLVHEKTRTRQKTRNRNFVRYWTCWQCCNSTRFWTRHCLHQREHDLSRERKGEKCLHQDHVWHIHWPK